LSGQCFRARNGILQPASDAHVLRSFGTLCQRYRAKMRASRSLRSVRTPSGAAFAGFPHVAHTLSNEDSQELSPPA